MPLSRFFWGAGIARLRSKVPQALQGGG